LLINAREAVGGNGQIRVETSQREGRAVLSVADNGCGMSPEFLRHSLFRPFQTTKKKGLGIGMFQSKLIIEAHRGSIQVESEPGKGTRFGIFLPLTAGSNEEASPAATINHQLSTDQLLPSARSLIVDERSIINLSTINSLPTTPL
jgi:K+-sensing histidine kinase KdpD